MNIDRFFLFAHQDLKRNAILTFGELYITLSSVQMLLTPIVTTCAYYDNLFIFRLKLAWERLKNSARCWWPEVQFSRSMSSLLHLRRWRFEFHKVHRPSSHVLVHFAPPQQQLRWSVLPWSNQSLWWSVDEWFRSCFRFKIIPHANSCHVCGNIRLALKFEQHLCEHHVGTMWTSS